MTTLGFVVLAKRPGQAPEVVSAVFPEPPENALEYCKKRQERDDLDAELYPLDPPAERGPVEYVIGEINSYAGGKINVPYDPER